MRVVRLVPLVLAQLALAPKAFAEEPASEPSQDLSTLNGQLVPVGDHVQYHHSFKPWIVSTDPLGWILGSYGASVSYGFTENLALRFDANFISPVDTSERGFEIGVGVPIYFRRTYLGAFLEPGFIVRGDFISGNATTIFGPQVLVGWHWSWDSGFSVAAAVGVGRDWSSNSDSDGGLFPNAYLRFGYAFE